uniref:Uncharacterized protein n=1 Tax=Compsopogon caeruleus TaxID=31354 RepID=A0A6T6CQV1_9RHOD|mmetsp:Transcript_820/g.1757  ORF Transcript_820/g.1757 Transcript_820/m.1757 type:complete len:217 (+) Transcript_820:137-787(+)
MAATVVTWGKLGSAVAGAIQSGRILQAWQRSVNLRKQSTNVSESHSTPPLFDVEKHAYRTQRPPIYRAPFLNASADAVRSLSDEEVTQALKSYGGLLRGSHEERLVRLLRAVKVRQKQLVRGIVVSNKMDKTVVVEVRRNAYDHKLKVRFFRRRNFMAHDEENSCREGDRVVIKECRPLSRHKAFVVVENYGHFSTTPQRREGVDPRSLTTSPDAR